ncbi:MAG TPA: transcriptional regulator [Steroidobacteraceae bacterium]|nr:transcriptional regulator [Steroidobacteraceae bacterium]
MASAAQRATRGAHRKGRGRSRLEALPGGAAGAGAEAADPDALLHHRLRLGIVSALAGTEALTFVELRELLETTDGNLSVHARRLEDAGYIGCAKSFADRRPRTEYRLAPAGRRALERYLAHMEALIVATRSALAR